MSANNPPTRQPASVGWPCCYHMDTTQVRHELMQIFDAMSSYGRHDEGHRTALHVQALLRCAATHLALPPLPGTAPVTASGNRVHPGCRGCQTPGRTCPGRPEFTQDARGRAFPGQLTMFPPDYQPPNTTPTGLFP